MDGAQWQVGLGKYAYEIKGYRKIATVGEDYSFIYTQVFGLVLEFCGAGGQMTNRQWVPLGTKDFASVIAALPDDVDAIYLGLGGARRGQFPQSVPAGRRQGESARRLDHGRPDHPFRQGQCQERADRHGRRQRQADTWEDPGWQAFVKDYQDAFPAGEALRRARPARHQLLRRDDGDDTTRSTR